MYEREIWINILWLVYIIINSIDPFSSDMKSNLDPVLTREISEKLRNILGEYKWPFEYYILDNGTLLAEEVLTDFSTNDPIPCPSIDQTIRYLEAEYGVIIESRLGWNLRCWEYKVTFTKSKIHSIYGICKGRDLPSRDSDKLEGIKLALGGLENEH